MQTPLAPQLERVAALLEQMPFPSGIRAQLPALRQRLEQLHPIAPYVAAAISVIVAVRVVLWLLQLPLSIAWPIFGWLSGNNTETLGVYNLAAQAAACVAGSKIAYEAMRNEQ